MLLGLHGCASLPPPPAAAFAVPPAWSVAVAGIDATAGAASLAQWWLRFDDPLLASLVAQALDANTTVKSAQAALRQARALRDVSAAALLPSVGAAASAQRGYAGERSTGSSFRAGLDASWELDIFGANRSAAEASDAIASASAASLGDVRVSIAAEVALAYITLRNAQVRLGIADDNLASQSETLQITQWRNQAGLVGALEVEQARSGVEQTRAQVPLLQTVIGQAGHALAVLTGKPPAALAGALAATGLLVGGIGIMNIMLVSVTERTREIGLRLAIGALEREVLMQFLIESVVLAALGGLIGIAIATGASFVLARAMGVPYLFDPVINLLSFAFAACIGVVFGYFPARRAAQMDPIEALRHE